MPATSPLAINITDVLQCCLVLDLTMLLLVALALCFFVHAVWTAMSPKSEVAQLRYKESTLSHHLLRTVPSFTQKYLPPIWASCGHIHTLAAMLLPGDNNVIATKEYLQLRDQGIVTLEWMLPMPRKTKGPNQDCDLNPLDPYAPVLLLIPGMAGSSNLLHNTSHRALLKGFRPVIVHSRGTTDLPLTCSRLLSFGDASDFREVVCFVKEKFSKAKIVALGHGVASVLLLSYLGEYGSSAHVVAAVAVSPVWDVQSLFENFPQPFAWLELASQKINLLRRASILRDVINLKKILMCRSLNELIDFLFLPFYQHKSKEEFWEKNNPLRDVDDIAVPLMFVRSMDDPIVPSQTTPYGLFDVYPNLFLTSLQCGGHCAFFQRDSMNSWAVNLSLEYLQSVLEFVKNDEKFKKSFCRQRSTSHLKTYL